MPTTLAAADAVVTAGLRAHLSPMWGHPARIDVSAYVKNDAGQVVGGLLGYLAWGTIEGLPPGSRKHHLRKRLGTGD